MENDNKADRLAEEVFQRLCIDKGTVNKWNFHVRPIQLATEVLQKLDEILSRNPDTWTMPTHPQDVPQIRKDIADLLQHYERKPDELDERTNRYLRTQEKLWSQAEQLLLHPDNLANRPQWEVIRRCVFIVDCKTDPEEQQRFFDSFKQIIETCIKRGWYNRRKFVELWNLFDMPGRDYGGSYCGRLQQSVLPLSPIDGNAARVARIRKKREE